MLTILALVAACLYGTADFLGGAGSRRAPVLALLTVSAPAGVALMLVAALLAGGASPAPSALAWGAAGGAVGGLGLIVFYVGLAVGPMSVVAPVSALVATLLPVGVAGLAGERPGPAVLSGATACLAAIVLVSMDPNGSRGTHRAERMRMFVWGTAWLRERAAPNMAASVGDDSALSGACSPGSAGCPAGSAGPASSAMTVGSVGSVSPPGARGTQPPARRGLLYGVAAGAAFGLFFVFLRNAGHGASGWGDLWPLVAARGAGAVAVLAAVVLKRARVLRWRTDRAAVLTALGAGILDAAANIFYVLATRHGLFSLAVVITSLYPAMTVLLARAVLGERMRAVQRAGLVLAALGIVLVTA